LKRDVHFVLVDISIISAGFVSIISAGFSIYQYRLFRFSGAGHGPTMRRA
jgi:hypothetical protein